MVILAVDYGDSHTGVAVCDPLELLASPVEVVRETGMKKTADRIAEIAAQKKAELIVVGYPKNMNATIGERAQKSEKFSVELHKRSGLQTVLWDERLTTVSAHYALNQTNVRGEKRKAVVDSVAAVMILQSYLDFRRNKGL
ncbi:MAG: Holliday junction resolvase RuvX [Oscillospiraceae bacterium]|nr:Holliday junction resolvase RuvX [Oscillospiraceae bacterium]